MILILAVMSWVRDAVLSWAITVEFACGTDSTRTKKAESMRLTYLYQDREHGLPPRDNTPPFTFSDIRSMAYKSPRVPLLDRPGKENQPLLSWTSTALKRKLDAVSSDCDADESAPGIAHALGLKARAVEGEAGPAEVKLAQYRTLLEDALAAIALLESSAHLLIRGREEHRAEKEILESKVESERKAWERCCGETEQAQLITGRLEVKRQRLLGENSELEKKLKASENLVAELVKKEPKDKGADRRSICESEESSA